MFAGRFFFFGAAPPFGRVGPFRSSQVCSALRRKRLGLPPMAALLQPLSQCCGQIPTAIRLWLRHILVFEGTPSNKRTKIQLSEQVPQSNQST